MPTTVASTLHTSTGPPPDAIRDAPPDGHEEELHERVDRAEQRPDELAWCGTCRAPPRARNGRTRPKPSRSRKIVRKIAPRHGTCASRRACRRSSSDFGPTWLQLRPFFPSARGARARTPRGCPWVPRACSRTSPSTSKPAARTSSVGASIAARAHLGIAHDALAARGLFAADLELRLHERDELAAGAGAPRDRGEQLAEADERRVDDDEIAGPPTLLGLERSRVRPLQHDDARIDAQLVRELAVADVDRDDLAAPRWSRQSVKPPVDAPTSRQRCRAASTPNVSSAPASLTPPRETYG